MRFAILEAVSDKSEQDNIISVINIPLRQKMADIKAPKSELGSAIFDISADQKYLIYAFTKDMTWIEIFDLECIKN